MKWRFRFPLFYRYLFLFVALFLVALFRLSEPRIGIVPASIHNPLKYIFVLFIFAVIIALIIASIPRCPKCNARHGPVETGREFVNRTPTTVSRTVKTRELRPGVGWWEEEHKVHDRRHYERWLIKYCCKYCGHTFTGETEFLTK